MGSTSHRSAIAAYSLVALFAVSGLVWDPFADGVTDDLASPWCRVGSPQSWTGRPCVIPMGATVGTR